MSILYLTLKSIGMAAPFVLFPVVLLVSLCQVIQNGFKINWLVVNVQNCSKADDFTVLVNVTELKYDDKIGNLSVTVNQSDDKNIVNIDFQLYNQLPSYLWTYFSLFEEVNGDPVFMFDLNGDACHLGNYYRSHPFIRFFATRLMKASSFPTSCPVKKVSRQFVTKF